MPAMYSTPLRYPGGKAKLAPFVRALFVQNGLADGHYVEPYAGGAGIAFELLFLEAASHIHLNDVDRSVYSFWFTVLNDAEWLCNKILQTEVTVREWKRQKEIHRSRSTAKLRDLAFAFFFLNRTNRSGILNGGIIGGAEQAGEWKIDARYNKLELVRRIQKIAGYRNRISVHNYDALHFIGFELRRLPRKTLVYFDPPYFVKGRRLYQDHYGKKEHEAISFQIQNEVSQPWMVSYDNVPEIKKFYADRRHLTYSLDYSAASRSTGKEVMFFCDTLRLPEPLPAGMTIRHSL
jgi:DNA adenine methylase